MTGDSELPITTALKSLRVIPKAVRLLWQASSRDLSWVSVGTVLLGVSPVAVAFVAKLIIDHLAGGMGVGTRLWILIAIEAGLLAATGWIRHSTQAAQQILRERAWHLLSLKTMGHAARLDLEFFESPESHDTLAKAQRELGFRPMLMTFALLSAAQDLVTVTSFIIVILAFHPLLVLLLLFALLPTLMAARDAGFTNFSTYDMTTTDGRRASYFDTLLTSDQTAKEVRLYNLAPGFLAQRETYAFNVIQARNEAARKKARAFSRADVASVLVQYLALAFVAAQAATQRITIGDFTLLALALSRSRQQLSFALTYLGELLEHSLFFNDLTKFLAFKPKITAPDNPTPVPSKPTGSIIFEDVTFSYLGAEEPVFRDFNLELRAGEATALVGVNGAGKTTLVKLLTRLYDPQAGSIELDGTDIRQFDLDDYRNLFGVILQDFVQYQLTVRENIALARGDIDPDQGWLERAARDAKSLELITTLPDGWNTQLGRQFGDSGRNLSGGEWQLIALTRALYRDAPVLIFDEPTAALDAEAEAELIQTYRDLTRGKLSLLITHRFNTVKMADRILVLEGGKIIEDGTHATLMSLHGRYRAMFTAQAQAYRLSP